MTANERGQITSNDYLDLIVSYNRNRQPFRNNLNPTIHFMNDKYSIGYVPYDKLSTNAFREFGYTPIPALFGLTERSSLEESGIQKLRRLTNFNLRGAGVLVGIIDTGIDYLHPTFRNKDGTTRIAAIWDQTIESENYPASYYYGTQYLSEDINQALSSDNPSMVVPSTDTSGHGTMLAGIAAGSEIQENGFGGIVPDSELIVVKLKQAKQNLKDYFLIPKNVECYQENDIMWGLQYVIEAARNLKKPVAICIGVGSSQGSHDGKGALSDMLSVTSNFPGIAVSVAAGNEGNSGRHFSGEINPSIGYSAVELNVGENESGFSMELWGVAPNTYSLDILTPRGEYIPRIGEGLRVNRDISFIFDRTVISVDYYMVESSTGDELIFLRFRKPSAGIWTFKIYTRGDMQGEFQIWLPMNGFISDNTYFNQPDTYTTIVSPGNSFAPITVTAYSTENDALYRLASKGYSRINTIKPEIAAPGVNIQAPSPNQGYSMVSGTSVAAAHCTGVAAMILEWAIIKNNYPGVGTMEIKKFLIRGSRRNPNIEYPNRDWGYGMIDIYNVFDFLRSSFQS